MKKTPSQHVTRSPFKQLNSMNYTEPSTSFQCTHLPSARPFFLQIRDMQSVLKYGRVLIAHVAQSFIAHSLQYSTPGLSSTISRVMLSRLNLVPIGKSAGMVTDYLIVLLVSNALYSRLDGISTNSAGCGICRIAQNPLRRTGCKSRHGRYFQQPRRRDRQ